MPHPDVFWYVLNGMGAQNNLPKKVLVTLFLYLFNVKTKWNIVYEYLKTKIFSIDANVYPQMHWTSNIFGPSATTIGRFGVLLNYPNLNFKKMVCPKNVWIWRCKDIVMQKSDKANSVIIVDKDIYIKRMENLLSDKKIKNLL